jgi:hypothetical protein
MFTFEQFALLIIFLYYYIKDNIPIKIPIHLPVNIEYFIIKIIYYLSTIYTHIKYIYIDLYENNPIVKYWIDFLYNNLTIIIKNINGVHIEPNETHWLNIFKIRCSNQETLYNYDYTEQYIHIEESTSEELLKKYNHMLQEKIPNFIKGESNTEILFLLKTPNFYLSNIFNEYNYDDELKIELEKSDVSFINIDYVHPLMKEPINILLDSHYFYIGNEILSKSFILRYLKYQTNSFEYSNDYVIKIMDSNINQITLNSNQYIVLEKDNYTIKNVIENNNKTT